MSEDLSHERPMETGQIDIPQELPEDVKEMLSDKRNKESNNQGIKMAEVFQIACYLVIFSIKVAQALMINVIRFITLLQWGP